MDGGSPGVTEFAGRVTERSGETLCIAPPGTVATTVVDRLYERYGAVTADDEPAVAGGDADDAVTDDAIDDATDGGVDADNEGTPTVRLLYPDDRIESLFASFGRATRAAELVERGELGIRTIDQVTQRLTVTSDRAYAHVRLDGESLAISAQAESFTESMRETYERQWTASEPAAVPAPPRDQFLGTFCESFPAAGETLTAVVDAEPSIETNGTIDPVTVVTLVAARHEIQTIELSEWAESIGFSSRTELSRVTNRLTDRGVVDTDRVPHGVGRPRQRLSLADAELGVCSPDEFLSRARAAYHGEAGSRGERAESIE